MKDQIEFHFNKAVDLAIARIEQEARTILRNHQNLDEFVMGMGICSFSTKSGGKIFLDEDDTPKYMTRLNEFIDKWDCYMKLTGVPMRFTATGKRITDW
jgi:hypothetical protein